MKKVRILSFAFIIAISISCTEVNPLEQIAPGVVIRTDKENYWLPSGVFVDTIRMTVWNNTSRKVNRLHPYETIQLFDGQNWKRYGNVEIIDRSLTSGSSLRFKTETWIFGYYGKEGKYRFIGEFIFDGEDTLSHSISNEFYLSFQK